MENGDRKGLCFEEIVKENFSFLETRYKFEIIYSGLYCVKYLARNVYCNLYHEKLSFEMDFVIGLAPEHIGNQLYINLEDLEKDQGINTIIKRPYFAVSKRSVETYIIEVANILKNYGEKSIIGDEEYYHYISDKKSKEQSERLKQENLIRMEKLANSAWQNNEYDKVVSIYSDIAAHLNSIQKKRLEIAKKRIDMG